MGKEVGGFAMEWKVLRGGQRKEGSLLIQRPEETLNGNGNS